MSAGCGLLRAAAEDRAMPWNSEDLLKISRGFMESRIFLSGAELDLYTVLSERTLTAAEVAARIAGEQAAVEILLDALAAMGLLRKEESAYSTDPDAARYLSHNSPDTVLPMVLHAAHLWDRWSGLTSMVGTPPAQDTVEAWTAAFIGAMHVVGAPRAARIVDLVNSAGAKRLLDVGGASGTYTIAFLNTAPDMAATLFDRPPVIELARKRLADAGLLHRVRLVPGDYYHDQLPSGHDLAFVSAIIHQNTVEENKDLYRNVFAALDSGGRIIIRDHVMNSERTQPRPGAIFSVNMLAGRTGGRSYTYQEIHDGLHAAGFTRIHLLHPDSVMDGLVEAHKP